MSRLKSEQDLPDGVLNALDCAKRGVTMDENNHGLRRVTVPSVGQGASMRKGRRSSGLTIGHVPASAAIFNRFCRENICVYGVCEDGPQTKPANEARGHGQDICV